MRDTRDPVAPEAPDREPDQENVALDLAEAERVPGSHDVSAPAANGHSDPATQAADRARRLYGGRPLKVGGIAALVLIIVVNVVILVVGFLSAWGGDGDGGLGLGPLDEDFATVPDGELPGAGEFAPGDTLPDAGAGEATTPEAGGGGPAAGGGEAGGGAGVLVPPAGVYSLQGSGGESLSPVGVSHRHATSTTGTLRHEADNCWTFRVQLNNDHWSETRYCAREGGLVSTGSKEFQRWDLLIMQRENTATLTCESPTPTVPAGAQPGQTWSGSCLGSSSDPDVPGKFAKKVSGTYVALEQVPVGNETVRAHHIQESQTIEPASGGNTQRGTVQRDMWFAESNGLPIRERVTSSTQSDSPIGAVTYKNNALWNVTSTQPR